MNKLEEIVKQHFKKRGYEPYKNGYPDFLFVNHNTNDVIAIEVKYKNDQLSDDQIKMHKIFEMLGIKVFIVRENDFMTADMISSILINSDSVMNLKNQISKLENGISIQMTTFRSQIESLLWQIKKLENYIEINKLSDKN